MLMIILNDFLVFGDLIKYLEILFFWNCFVVHDSKRLGKLVNYQKDMSFS